MRQEFRLVIESPYGKQPIESFRHFMSKISDDALTRWGIELRLTEIDDSDDVDESEFQ
jgi:hypothetical protein